MPSHRTLRRGSATMAAVLLTFLGSVSVLALLRYSSNSAHMTRRTLDYQRARLVAEAGLDYGVKELQDLILRYQFTLTQEEMQDQVDQLSQPPALSDYEHVSPSGDPAFRITVDTEPTQGLIPQGNVAIGEEGEYQLFTITSGALNPDSNVGAVLTQRIQATSIFIMRFGVFYWYDLEINPGPIMYFDGPIHGNHDTYITGPLQIRAPITSHGAIYHDRKDSRSPNRGSTAIYNDDGDPVRLVREDGTVIDSTSSTWMTDSLSELDGNAQDSSHGVPLLTPPINELDEPYDIIRQPLPTSSEDYREETEREKFGNKAALRIHVDANGNLSATDFRGQDKTYKLSRAQLRTDGEVNGAPLYEKDDDGNYEMDTEGSFDTDQRFLDTRENVTVAPVDLYVDQLMEEFPELFTGADYGVSEGRGVVYVTRDEPIGGGVMPAVRLRNGREMPPNGLTVATDLPIYVEGNYNVGDTREPSMVTGDAVTMLSSNWQDARSTSGLNNRPAANTEFNTVVMTGNTETVAGGQYNGGLENVLRFLETWSNRTVRFRGSIIDLWYSEIANAPWSYGNYYTAPSRDWEFDPILRTQAPPGVPRVFGLEMLSWRVSTWEEQGWN